MDEAAAGRITTPDFARRREASEAMAARAGRAIAPPGYRAAAILSSAIQSAAAAVLIPSSSASSIT